MQDKAGEYLLQSHGYSPRDLSHLLFDCPAVKPFHRNIVSIISSIFDLIGPSLGPWGVARNVNDFLSLS